MMMIMAQKTITIMKKIMSLVSTPRLSLQSPPTQD